MFEVYWGKFGKKLSYKHLLSLLIEKNSINSINITEQYRKILFGAYIQKWDSETEEINTRKSQENKD